MTRSDFWTDNKLILCWLQLYLFNCIWSQSVFFFMSNIQYGSRFLPPMDGTVQMTCGYWVWFTCSVFRVQSGGRKAGCCLLSSSVTIWICRILPFPPWQMNVSRLFLSRVVLAYFRFALYLWFSKPHRISDDFQSLTESLKKKVFQRGWQDWDERWKPLGCHSAWAQGLRTRLVTRISALGLEEECIDNKYQSTI